MPDAAFDAGIADILREVEEGATSRLLAAEAAAAIEDARRTNRRALGADAPYSVAVDGKEGAPLSSVRANSVVVGEWRLVEEAVEWIGRELVKASPVLTGAYARSHALFVDGVEHEIGQPLPGGATRFVFVNRQPYSRKIEGDIGRPAQSPQAPDGVYQVVAAMADDRFAAVADIRFGYQAIHEAPQRSTRAQRRAENESRHPAIFVRGL